MYHKDDEFAKNVRGRLHSLLFIKWVDDNSGVMAIDAPLQIHLKSVV